VNFRTPFLALLLALGLMAAATGCKRGPDQARRDLQKAGFQTTPAELVRAAAEGHSRAVGWFLTIGSDPNVADAEGFTPLMAAAEHGHAEIVKQLLAAGADVNARGREGWTALMMAASFSDKPECARLLLEAGADVHFKDPNGWTALMQAVYKGNAPIVALLAERSRPDLDRALLVAALSGHLEVARVLLEHGADRHITTDEGDTPLHLAIRRGHADVAVLLLRHGADPGALNRKGESPRRLAARLGNAQVTALVDAPDPIAATDGAAEADWLRKHKLDPAQPAILDADSDQDGATNRDEFLAGTDPRSAASKPGAVHQARLAAYHGEELPILLEKITDQGASIRVAEGAAIRVRDNDAIPGLPYRVLRTRQRQTTDKEGQQIDVSELHLEETDSGRRVVLVPGLRAKSPASHAELLFPGSEQPVRVHQDEEFTPPGSTTAYRVVDLREEQVVLRSLSDGRVVTIPKSR